MLLLFLLTLLRPATAPAAPLCIDVAKTVTAVTRRVNLDVLHPGLKKVDSSLIYQTDSALRADFNELAAAPKESRHAVVEKIETDLRAKSARDLTEVHSGVRSGEPFEVPLLIIGGGAHAAIVRLAASKAQVASLTLEAGSTVSAQVFGGGPDVFTLNTYPEATLIPGAPIQMPFFNRETYPVARDLHDTILTAHAAASGLLLFGSKVKDGGIRLRADGRYDVETENGLSIIAKAIVTSTGLSKATVVANSAESKDAIEKFRAIPLDHGVSRFQYFDDYLIEMQKGVGNYDANEPYDNKVVAVIGRGPSANVAIENLFGNGPEQMYAGSAKGRGPTKIIWINGFTTREEFLRSNIKRYHNETFSPELWQSEHFEVVEGRVQDVRLLPSHKLRCYLDNKHDAADSERRFVDIDAAIAATGYGIGVKDLMSSANASAPEMKLTPVIRRTKGQTEIIGRKLDPYPHVYVVGAAAGPFLTPEEAKSRPIAVQNPVNLPHTALKTKAMAEQILTDLKKL